MHIVPMKLDNQSKLITDYRNNKADIMGYFDYSPYSDYEKRLAHLKQQTFDREQLSNVLVELNKQWDAPSSTLHNIERLKDEESVVIIGGQQAGLLTGPMYSINKAISLIQFAKQKEAELGIPVIPVFWIAGEDHDYDEINHIYIKNNAEMKKHILTQQEVGKAPIANIKKDNEKSMAWIKDIFYELNETDQTKDLYRLAKSCLSKSKTYVDFFARFIYELFNKEGLVLIDSANKSVRQLESKFFIKLIEKQEDIAQNVLQTYENLKESGYDVPLDVEHDDAHLFYHRHNERILLKRNKHGEWIGKQNEIKLTTEELIKIAKETPEQLSNNVVTRPLMQELLFPTLSFVGGSGEISYWAVLKSAFHSLGINMPPVLPRLSFTYVDQRTEKLINKYALSIEDAINYGVKDEKEAWLAKKNDPSIGEVTKQVKLEISKAHHPLRKIAEDTRADLGELGNKNLDYLYRHIDYLELRLTQELEERFAAELYDFDVINNNLHPNDGLQERVWNIVPIANEHSIDFIHQLTKKQLSFEEEHFIIYI